MCQIQGHAPDVVICALEAAHWKVESSRRDLVQTPTHPEWTAFSPGSDLVMPYVTLPSWLPTFLRVVFELTECLESLCKPPHLGAVGCKPKIYFSSKIGSPGRAEQEETKAENRKLGYGKTQEARLQLPGRAGEAGYGVVLGPCPGAGVKGALETQHQVQHLQEELNTRLLRQLCWNNHPPVQL